MLPGDALKSVLADIEIHPNGTCPCDEYIQQMNAWGLARCRLERATIVGWLRAGYAAWGWRGRLAYAARAVVTGAAFTVPWDDPIGFIVDKALGLAPGGCNPV